jgi:hypothetical protein
MNDMELLREIRDDVRAVRQEMTGALMQIASLQEWRSHVSQQDTEARMRALELEARVRVLELSKAKFLGWAAAAGGGASMAIQFLSKKLGL